MVGKHTNIRKSRENKCRSCCWFKKETRSQKEAEGQACEASKPAAGGGRKAWDKDRSSDDGGSMVINME